MDKNNPSTWTIEYKRSLYLGLHRQLEIFKLFGQQEAADKLKGLMEQLPPALGFSPQDVADVIAYGEAEDERLRAVLVNLGLEVRTKRQL